ncbi:MAG: hypothetical protein A4E47_01670 [Methanosaeta sp. PtaU1.Bin028]|nr:MAG: hypothetical protein A4E47_01670 [Methanosaeta sp. PtaU1.Bin028]
MIRVAAIMFVLLILGATSSQARTFIVDDDSFAEFSSISKAVAAAKSGDTIYLKPGVYQEGIVVNKTLTIKPLLGEKGEFVLAGDGTARVGLSLEAPGCVVEGLTIRDYEEAGIQIVSDGNVIRKNVMSGSMAGLLITGGKENLVESNILLGSLGGIAINSGAKGNMIRNNQAQGCNFSIIVKESRENSLQYNNISSCDYGIYVTNSSSTSISGGKIENANCGLRVEDSSATSATGMALDGASVGLSLRMSIGGDFQDNAISRANDTAIEMIYSSGNLLKSNRITNSSYGITMAESGANKLEENRLDGVDLGLYVEGSGNKNLNNSISESNTVDKVPLIYIYGQEGCSITGRQAAHITLAACRNCSVENNTITNDAIFLVGSEYNQISNNLLHGIFGGIRLANSKRNVVSTNEITDNRFTGVFLYNSSLNRVAENIISGNGNEGLALIFLSDENDISTNVIQENRGYGIRTNFSDRNRIYSNQVRGSGSAGLLIESSNSSAIYENNITSNPVGAVLRSSYSNWIYHNNFAENEEQASDSGNNSWDMGMVEGGNYWSDHHCTGIPCQGLPKLIKGPAYDRYPFPVASGWTLPRTVLADQNETNQTSIDLKNASLPVLQDGSGSFQVSGEISGTATPAGPSLAEGSEDGRAGSAINDTSAEINGSAQIGKEKPVVQQLGYHKAKSA